MIDPNNFTSEDMKALPKTAIRRIRAICRGNGCKAEDVKIVKASGNMHNFIAHTHIDLEPSIERTTRKGRHQIGEYIENPASVDKVLQDMASSAIKNPDSRKFLADKILKRPDRGFGLQGEVIDVEQLKRSFCTHEPCHTCQGVGNTVCDQCHGQRKEPCNHCRTKGMVPCDYCNGRGTMQGPDGKQKQCNRCFGHRQTSCPTCQRTGYISCRKCRGSGTSTCKQCQGAAFMTHIINLAVRIKTGFIYDKTELPPAAALAIDKTGPRLSMRQHLHIQSDAIKRDDGGLAVEYKVAFPFGNIEFKVKNKHYTAQILGFKAKLIRLPHFLSDLLKNSTEILKNSTQNAAQSQDLLDKVIKTRFYADAVYLSTQMKSKKAYATLMKKYPIGADKNFYKQSIIMSRKAVMNASRSARWMAYGMGAAINAVLFGLYFIGPLRGMALNSLSNPIASIIFDVICLIMGSGLAAFVTLKISRRPIKQIIERIKGVQKKKKIKIDLLPTYGISAGIFLICALIAVLIFNKNIIWLPL